MMVEPLALSAPMTDGDLRLEMLSSDRVSALRAACAADPDVWTILPLSFVGDAFGSSLAAILERPGWHLFAILVADRVAGMTAFIEQAHDPASIDIGATFLAPAYRGTGLNGRVKRLMVDRARAAGRSHIGFRIDARNVRSMRAVEKLGAVRERLIERDFRIWTGHWRDTAVYRLDIAATPTARRGRRSRRRVIDAI